MAKSGFSERQILDITECPICAESFKVPKVLPCIHTFCLQCLERYGEDHKPADNMNCPLCRKPFVVPPGSFKDLPNNFLILQLLQLNQQSTSELAELQHVVCDLCTDIGDNIPAAAEYCIECEQHLCEPCSIIHKKLRTSKEHKVMSLKDKPCVEELMKMAPSYCENHPNKEIEFYCYDCKMIACVVCYTDHKLSQHKCCDIRQSGEEFRIQLKDDIERVAPCISKSRDEMRQLEDDKRGLIYKVEKIKSEISKKYAELKSLLELHQEQLTYELDSFREKRLKEIETSKDGIERQLVILESFTRYCTELNDKGTSSDITHTANNLHTRAEELVKCQDEIINNKFFTVDIITPSSEMSDNMIGKLLINEYNLSQQHAKDIRSNYVTLTKDLQTNPMLLSYLYANGVISFVEMESITSEQDSYSRNQRILSLIAMRSEKDYECFTRALEISGQSFLLLVSPADVGGDIGPSQPSICADRTCADMEVKD